MITHHPFHAELEALIRPENHVPDEGFSEESPSGRLSDTELLLKDEQGNPGRVIAVP